MEALQFKFHTYCVMGTISPKILILPIIRVMG